MKHGICSQDILNFSKNIIFIRKEGKVRSKQNCQQETVIASDSGFGRKEEITSWTVKGRMQDM